MRDVYETFEYRGHTVETGFETDDIFDPRDNDGNAGVLNIAIRNYTYGDEQTDPSDMLVPCRVCVQDCERDIDRTGMVPVPTTDERREHTYGHFDPSWVSCPACDGYGEVSDPVRWAVEVEGATVVLPVYAYIHSGTTFRTSVRLYPPTQDAGGNPFHCQWDSGLAGITYDTPETRKDRFYGQGKWYTESGGEPSVDEVEAALVADLEVYTSYIEGDIMWYRIEGPTCDDACGGFFPDEKGHGYMEDEARGCIDGSIQYAWVKGIEEVVEQRKIASMMAL